MMLMLVATQINGDETEPNNHLAVRFFESEDGCEHVRKLARQQIKKRFPNIPLGEVEWDVYEPQTKRGGWPKWLGPSEYYA